MLADARDVRLGSWLGGAMASWVTDFGHLPGPSEEKVNAAGRRRAAFTREIVQAATSRPSEGGWRSAVRCIGGVRSRQRVCGARVIVEFVASDEHVAWSCDTCGEDGMVTGIVGTDADVRAYWPQGKTATWGFDDEERQVLMKATEQLPWLRAILSRARPHAEIPDLLILNATVPELDDVYTLVEELTDLTRSPRRHELLDGLRMSLCTSMDGF